jgi:hypothetical protein
MARKKKTVLDKATDIVATIILEQIDTLAPDVAKAKRKELHALAAKVSRSSPRGKRVRQSQNGDLRLVSRSRAKTA